MKEKALRKLSVEEVEAIPENFRYEGGAIKPGRPDLVGDYNFTCPHCNVVLVENTTEAGVKAGFKKIQCYNCREWCAP